MQPGTRASSAFTLLRRPRRCSILSTLARPSQTTTQLPVAPIARSHTHAPGTQTSKAWLRALFQASCPSHARQHCCAPFLGPDTYTAHCTLHAARCPLPSRRPLPLPLPLLCTQRHAPPPRPLNSTRPSPRLRCAALRPSPSPSHLATMVNSYGEFADFCRDSGNQWSTLPGTKQTLSAFAHTDN